MHPNVAMRLDMSRILMKGHYIFHVGQLTPYFDGTDLFPSRTPESLQSYVVAHLDGWETYDIEYAVTELKASRVNPTTKQMEWFVSWKDSRGRTQVGLVGELNNYSTGGTTT
jgi:hypothetical protein